MKHDAVDNNDVRVATQRAINVSSRVRATSDEVARRRALRDEARRIRERIGPVGVNAVDLIDLDFYDNCDSQ